MINIKSAMELRHLRYFIAVAEELHFRRAAERLHISQPPLSLQIAELERELGAKLFERTSQRVSLTPAGRIFLHQARGILEQLSTAIRDVRRAADGEIGELRVAFTQSFEFLHLLPETIHAFGQRHPGVSFSLEQMQTGAQIKAIQERQLDLGVSRRPAGAVPGEVELTKLLDDPLLLAVNSSNPLAGRTAVTMADLRDERFILGPANQASGLRDMILQLCQGAGFSPRIGQQAREVPTMLGLVAANVGVTIVPASARRMGMRGLTFLTIADAGAASALYMATLRAETGRLLSELKQMLLAAAASGSAP